MMRTRGKDTLLNHMAQELLDRLRLLVFVCLRFYFPLVIGFGNGSR